MPTLYLIDGYAQFFRAYHAIRTPMTSPVTKEPTNMSFGFLGMLLKLLRGEGKLGGKPDYIALTLDISGDRGTFRTQLYEQYKANRSAPPEDLKPQVERCLAALRDVGMPIIGADGFEADDVIATLVTTLRKRHPDLRVRIISKDKDLKQLLVNDHVELFDIHTEQIINQESLKADTGLNPEQVIDYLALMGDTVDNVPGVEGVGPKTAAQLIAQYGSLDGVLTEAAKADSEIKGKRLENIRAAAGRLGISKELVTLRRDVPIALDLDAAAVDKLKLDTLAGVFRTLGFNRYQDELKALLGAAGLSPVVATAAVAVAEAVSKVGVNGSAGKKTSGGGGYTGGLFDSLPGGGAVVQPQSGAYRCITSEKELRELVDELRSAEIISIDTETTGLESMRCKLAGICLSTKVGTGVYVPVRSPTPKEHLDEKTVLAALRPLLEDADKPKCGHNLKFDRLVLRAHNVRLAGFTRPFSAADATGLLPDLVSLRSGKSVVFDSMIASYLIDPTRSSHGMDALALALLGRTNISIKDLIGSGKASEQRCFDQVPLDQATQYAAEDADVALQLREVMLPQLRAMGLLPLFEYVEMPLVDVLAELEWNGIRVDRAELSRQQARLQTRINELKKEITAAAMTGIGRSFNPDSPKQLAAALFNKPTDEEPGFGIKPLRKIKTGYSTDTEVLETLAEDPAITNQIPKLIVEHRSLTKLVSTYLVALADAIYPPESLGAARVHASFNQTVASTGRLSASDPNLQNIPIRTDIGREIRRAFIADPGHVLISADYSQIELRLLAHLSRDPALIAAFHEGQDIHTAVAAQIHGVALDQVTKDQRSGAKMVNFGIVYGITPFGLARRLGISNTQAGEIIDGYKRKFAGITTFLQECVDQAQRFGYVQTILGRRRPITDIGSSNPSRRALAERMAINSVVQGSAADLIKLAMVELHALEASGKLPARMLLQIHDELVFETIRKDAEEAKRVIVERMEGAMQLKVPLKVDASIAENWFEGK